MTQSKMKWQGTSLILPTELENNKEFRERLARENISLVIEENRSLLRNEKNHFIFENDFIEQCTNISIISNKLRNKSFADDSKIFNHETCTFNTIKAQPVDLVDYSNIISNNILDGDLRNFEISINVLNEVLNIGDKSRAVLDFFILLALAPKSAYDAEMISVNFLASDGTYKFKFDIMRDKPLNLYPIYSWIFNEKESASLVDTKLQIVRSTIIKKQTIHDVRGILEDSKLIYNRTISGQTKDYFEQINRLKDDFLVLSNNEQKAMRTLNVTFFAWLGYLGIEILQYISEYNGNNLIRDLFFSQGEKPGVVVLMLSIALIFIFLGYYYEVSSLRKEHEVIRTIYRDVILLEDNNGKTQKFDNLIKKPRVGRIPIVIFLIIMTFLFIRFIFTLPW